MDFLEYFNRTDVDRFIANNKFDKNQIGSVIQTQVEELSEIDIALFNVEEDRASQENEGSAKGGEEVRRYLYQLYKGDHQLRIIDFGTIKAGDSVLDTYFALKDTISTLLKAEVLPIIIGGSADLCFANYLAYTELEQSVNLVSIDSKFALGDADEIIKSSNYLSKVLFHQPNALFNFSNLGYQSYFVNPDELRLLNDLFYDIYRLGEMKKDIKLTEPIIRNADFISFNLNAVAQPFASANNGASPNGFTGEEACQMAKYAGMNDKLTSFGIYEFNPKVSDNGMTAHLVAQMIWYFIEGYYQRQGDFPISDKKDYLKYNVNPEEGDENIIFYKSQKTDRWWMEVPYHSNISRKYKRHLMLPCNYQDYITATEGEIPERWFQTFKKLK